MKPNFVRWIMALQIGRGKSTDWDRSCFNSNPTPSISRSRLTMSSSWWSRRGFYSSDLRSRIRLAFSRRQSAKSWLALPKSSLARLRNSLHNLKSSKRKSNKEKSTSKSNLLSKSTLPRLNEKRTKSQKLWPFGNKKEPWLSKILNKYKADLTRTKTRALSRLVWKKWRNSRRKRAPDWWNWRQATTKLSKTIEKSRSSFKALNQLCWRKSLSSKRSRWTNSSGPRTQGWCRSWMSSRSDAEATLDSSMSWSNQSTESTTLR